MKIIKELKQIDIKCPEDSHGLIPLQLYADYPFEKFQCNNCGEPTKLYGCINCGKRYEICLGCQDDQN